jgi:hypothetical protein
MRPTSAPPKLPDEPAPAAHERRFLVRLSHDSPEQQLINACVHCQQAYLGSVFVAVDTRSLDSGESDLVGSLVAAGCTGQLTSFYEPHRIRGLGELAELISRIWRQTASERDVRPGPRHTHDVAEVLAVGATDTIGVAGAVIESARATAFVVNNLLAATELPLPVPRNVKELPGAPLPAAEVVSAGGGSPFQLGDLLTQGSLEVSQECDQRIELLYEVCEGHYAL